MISHWDVRRKAEFLFLQGFHYKLVDKTGVAVILKNNTPRYVILDFALLKGEEFASTDEALASARSLINKHLPAFKELAK